MDLKYILLLGIFIFVSFVPMMMFALKVEEDLFGIKRRIAEMKKVSDTKPKKQTVTTEEVKPSKVKHSSAFKSVEQVTTALQSSNPQPVVVEVAGCTDMGDITHARIIRKEIAITPRKKVRVILFLYQDVIKRTAWMPNESFKSNQKAKDAIQAGDYQHIHALKEKRVTLSDLPTSTYNEVSAFALTEVEVKQMLHVMNEKGSKKSKATSVKEDAMDQASVSPGTSVVSSDIPAYLMAPEPEFLDDVAGHYAQESYHYEEDPMATVESTRTFDMAIPTEMTPEEESFMGLTSASTKNATSATQENIDANVDIYAGRKPRKSNTGTIEFLGMKTYRNDSGPYEAFTVILRDRSNNEHELRGTELKAEISRIGARKGDRVKINSFGRVAVSIPKDDGGSIQGKKNLYQVTMC